jgi:acyl-CoA synthetase (AMP-forming)/AMP-acid ligase II
MTAPIAHLYHRAEQSPNAIAIAGPGEPFSYRRLATVVDALAAALQSIDPDVGSRVGICARNTVEHLIALLATYAAGKVWVPLNPTNSRADLDRMIGATRPTMFVADEACLDSFTPTGAPIVVGKTTGGATEQPTVRGLIGQWSGRRPATVTRDDGDAQIIKFSGGSTGVPKPVVQSLRCVNAQVHGTRLLRLLRDVGILAARDSVTLADQQDRQKLLAYLAENIAALPMRSSDMA